MVRAATLETGRARLAVLAAAALLLASLLSMVGGVAAPSPALAVSNSNCNSAINPIGADGVTVSFTNANGNIGSAGGQATTWYDPNDGKFYGQAIDGAASGTSTIVEVRVTYGGSNGTDPWCIFTGTVVQTGGGYNLRDATLLFVDELPATDATSYTFTATFDLASFGITDATGSVCVASRISSRQGGGGAPKGSACLTVATHTVTGQPTPTPSGSATPTPSASTSPSPTSSVEGATAPPTDSLTGSRGSSNPALGLVLLVLALVVGGAGLLSPRFRGR